MKKVFKASLALLAAALIFSGCTKSNANAKKRMYKIKCKR